MARKSPVTPYRPELETLTPGPGLPDPGLVAGRYQVKRFLGRGASKDVFLARDIRLDREVALARVTTGRDRGTLPPRLLQEIRTTAQLDEHPHIVTVHDVIDEDGAVWIVSQLVRGGSLAELLARHPDGLAVDDAVRLAHEVADALHFAHEHGVIHRDVKPSNVLLAGSGNTALLTDFGVAFLPDHPRLTLEGAPIGTAVYMAPEQARGGAVDRRADLYALGVMLFELICGRPPFAGDTIATVIAQHLNDPPPNPCQINPAVPDRLGRLILQLLRKHPHDRPSSGVAVCQSLDAIKTRAAPAAAMDPPTSGSLPAFLGRDSTPRIVGRRSALAEITRAWREAGTGRPRFALISGEAGIGKTSLASAFAHSALDDGAVVLYGRCDEDPLVSYQPFVEALRQLIATWPDVVAEVGAGWDAEMSELAELIPELRRHRVATPAAGERPESLERYHLFEAVLALLSPVVTRQPLLLLLDDMQWADKPTELLLRHVMRSRLSRLLVLVTRRPPEAGAHDPLGKVTEDLERDISDEHRLVRVSLAGLNAQETHELASLRNEGPVDREFSRLLQANTAGNPFFIEQVVRGLRDYDLSERQHAVAALRSLRVPEGVQGFIEYRLAAFSAETTELLEHAAACGPEFRLDVLADLRGADAESVMDLLAAPMAAGLVVEARVGRFAFSHALVRETLYQRRLGMSERAQLHLRIGQALERMQPRGVHPPELALHFHAAREVGGAERAVTYALAAADGASAALAYEEAASYTRDACDALEFLGQDHDEQRCRLLQSAGRLRWRAGDQKGAQEEFRRAAALARQLGDATQLARAALGYAGRSYDAEAIDPDLRALIEEALATLPERETALRAKLLARLAEALHPVDDSRAIQLTEDALEVLRRSPDNDALTTVLAAREVALLHIEHHQERMENGRRWVELAEAGQRDSLGMALNWRVFDFLESGDPGDIQGARLAHRRLDQLADKLDQPLYRHFAACIDAKWLLMEGRFAESEDKARQGYVHGRRAQGTHVVLLFGGHHFGLRRDQGRLGELPGEVAAFLGTDNPSLPIWRAGLILARGEAGDRERAHRELREAARDGFAAIPHDMFWLGAMCLLAECAAELDDPATASELLPALARYAKYNAQIGLATFLGPVGGFLGPLAAMGGDDSAAEEYFRSALDRTRVAGAATAEARVGCLYGEFLLSRAPEPGRERGLELLERSEATARRLGMVAVAGRAGRALERAGAVDPASGGIGSPAW